MKGRSEIMDMLRGEIVGPTRPSRKASEVTFDGRVLVQIEPDLRGPKVWLPGPGETPQEVLHARGEAPARRYGSGVLHPEPATGLAPEEAARLVDVKDVDVTEAELYAVGPADEEAPTDAGEGGSPETASADADTNDDDEFEVIGGDVRRPSSIGISFAASMPLGAVLKVRLPRERHFRWQREDAPPHQVNGLYERCERATARGKAVVWRRIPALAEDIVLDVPAADLRGGTVIQRDVPARPGSGLDLRVDVFSRRITESHDGWLLTVVLRNRSRPDGDDELARLYQTYFEVHIEDGSLSPYPESPRPFDSLDEDERSLALLYRSARTWGIGHGCAAGWDVGPDEVPSVIYADVMPAVELPSMTPNIRSRDGAEIKLPMRELAALDDAGSAPGWRLIDELAVAYLDWIESREAQIASLPEPLRDTASAHMERCRACARRIQAGIGLLRSDGKVRQAFRLANQAMLLQQVATKDVAARPLVWEPDVSPGAARPRRARGAGAASPTGRVGPSGTYRSPLQIVTDRAESKDVGFWRAFQLAFFLMSLEGLAVDSSSDRETVDLIWFPTGGGKTEAYLGVMSFFLFYERFRMEVGGERRDGTNVLMRYTLRMLTTQQFQRAASLVCAMEVLRRDPSQQLSPVKQTISGDRFGLGLWIGKDGSPNNQAAARVAVNEYRTGRIDGNPLVLTECPWCRAEIGRCRDRPEGLTDQAWRIACIAGIAQERLLCPDASCDFGGPDPRSWLPIEVIDEFIYDRRPSIVIGTADKFAILAYKPQAGRLLGSGGGVPPGLIVQDELHLISGPLGTMYGLYETMIEKICTRRVAGTSLRPKIISSTATIRGAREQVRALYARHAPDALQLFPTPGLDMGDSFFGQYARDPNGCLSPGRMYFGIHAPDLGSVLTTQVRTFSTALFAGWARPEGERDPWWTLLCFFNSIRELGGAKTLMDSDVPARLKFMFFRDGIQPESRRHLVAKEELTSRLTQAQVVGMMSKLGRPYSAAQPLAVDTCLASSIIEVGVDIDRLSLMAVIGQPKSTAQYIQVTGRIGRRWWERPGLVLMVYNPFKSRDRSHYEQFHSYHRRLYERVEPTVATPFAIAAIQRALVGAMLVWIRQQPGAGMTPGPVSAHRRAITEALEAMRERCLAVQGSDASTDRSLAEMEQVADELLRKWSRGPQKWEKWPPDVNDEYLMLWPGQFYTRLQRARGIEVPSSLRQVDASAELGITQAYAIDAEEG